MITKLIEKEGKISIDDVSRKFDVSKVTARSDFDDLERRGLLVRTHGGAVAPENRDLVRLISKTIHEREEEKNLIADTALTLITEESTIIIDSGSTTSFLSRRLRDIKLSVITNSIMVMKDLYTMPDIELFVSGGVLRKPSMSLIGSGSGEFMKQFRADIAFLGATSASIDHGISCTNLIEAETKRNMIKSAIKVCLLVDSSKMGNVSLAHVCGWNEINTLITDSIHPEERAKLEESGVEVLLPATDNINNE